MRALGVRWGTLACGSLCCRLPSLQYRALIAGQTLSTAFRFQASSATDNEEELGFDITASIKAEMKTMNQSASIAELVDSLLPPNADAAKEGLRSYFRSKPVNRCITADTIIITHIQNAEGVDEKNSSIAQLTLNDALQMATDNNMDLVQMAGKDNVAYCRLRREIEAAMKSVEHLLPQTANNLRDKGKDLKLRDTVTHSFRDAVDAHFIGWRSKKIVKDMEKGHPVKLQIEKFTSPDAAINKMKEMLSGIMKEATADGVMHHHTGVNANDKELVVLLSPSVSGKATSTIKHPSDADWNRAEQRFLQLTGGKGTYVKNNFLKARNIGAREYPVDKFGRRKA